MRRKKTTKKGFGMSSWLYLAKRQVIQTPTSGELGYWEQLNAGTWAPLGKGEASPLHVIPFGIYCQGKFVAFGTHPVFEAQDQNPDIRVSGKDPPPLKTVERATHH